MILSVILLSMLMIRFSIQVLSECDLWQQLRLAIELEFDLRDNVNWGRKWLNFNAGKLN